MPFVRSRPRARILLLRSIASVFILCAAIAGCSRGPSRGQFEALLAEYVSRQAQYDPNNINVVGSRFQIESFELGSIEVAESGRQARANVQLKAFTWDIQWRPPQRRDASGWYFVDFARDEYGKWRMIGTPYREG